MNKSYPTNNLAKYILTLLEQKKLKYDDIICFKYTHQSLEMNTIRNILSFCNKIKTADALDTAITIIHEMYDKKFCDYDILYKTLINVINDVIILKTLFFF